MHYVAVLWWHVSINVRTTVIHFQPSPNALWPVCIVLPTSNTHNLVPPALPPLLSVFANKKPSYILSWNLVNIILLHFSLKLIKIYLKSFAELIKNPNNLSLWILFLCVIFRQLPHDILEYWWYNLNQIKTSKRTSVFTPHVFPNYA